MVTRHTMNTSIWCNTLILLVLLSQGFTSVSADQTLVSAAKEQDWRTLSSQLDLNGNVNEAQADGTTILAWAVYWNNLEIISKLIEANADVNIGNDLGVTPLLLATSNRNPDVVSILLKAGASTDKAMWTGETPLMTAVRTGQREVVQLLLDNGADINTSEPRRGQTALMWAISFGHPEIARVLIERGAEVNTKTIKLTESQNFSPMILEGYAGNVNSVAQGGYTALMFAARIGDMQTARLLVDRGSEVNMTSAEDGSALVIASTWGHETLALYLLEQGANPDVADANGMTALHYSMRDGLKLLHGYEIAATTQVCGYADNSYCKPLEAITNEERELLKDPANILGIYLEDVRPNNKFLPGNNMHDLAEALLARGADVNAKMKYPPPLLRLDSTPLLNLTGATPFMLASASLNYSSMEMLLEHGADPLIKTDINNTAFIKQTSTHGDDNQILGNGTPLMVTMGMGKKNDFSPEEELIAIQAASRMIKLGADVNETTATGWTALHAATFRGANKIIAFLVENGADINVKNGCGVSPLGLATGDSIVGILYRLRPRQPTIDLLVSLGADDDKATGPPVGTCILGKGGIEADIEIANEIEAARTQNE